MRVLNVFVRPLVAHFGMLDNMVLLTPLLRLLHRRYGQPCRIVGSGHRLEPLLAGHPDVQADGILLTSDSHLGPTGAKPYRTWPHALSGDHRIAAWHADDVLTMGTAR